MTDFDQNIESSSIFGNQSRVMFANIFFFNTITTIKIGIVHGGHSPYMVSKVQDFEEKMGSKSHSIISQINWGK